MVFSAEHAHLWHENPLSMNDKRAFLSRENKSPGGGGVNQRGVHRKADPTGDNDRKDGRERGDDMSQRSQHDLGA